MAAQPENMPQTSIELTPAQRIERLVLIVALIGLTLTGIPQRYSTQEWAHFLIVIGGGIESLRILHRFFALLLMAEALYHALALAYRWFVVGQRPLMLPGLRDFRDFIERILSNIGLRRDDGSSPHFVLKFEYLVLIIGGIVLIITGIMLWSPIRVTSVLPGETIPVARTIHSDHALLTVSILVLLRVGIALFWRPKRAEIYAQHPVTAPPERISQRRKLFIPVAALVALIVVAGVVAFVTSEQTAITTVPRRQAVIYAPQTIPISGDPQIGAVLWGTLRCAFCHGENGEGGIHGEPSLRPPEVPYPAFYEQVRIGRGEMPAFTSSELPDGYLVHLWAWLNQPAAQ